MLVPGDSDGFVRHGLQSWEPRVFGKFGTWSGVFAEHGRALAASSF